MVEPHTGAQRVPFRHVEIALNEEARNREGVIELRQLARAIGVTLDVR